MPDTVTHWTNQGTFLIEEVFIGGSWNYHLWHEKDKNKTDLKLFTDFDTAAESIGQGKHDEALGFAASALGVPPLVKNWNRK
jgi:hypothetical protein